MTPLSFLGALCLVAAATVAPLHAALVHRDLLFLTVGHYTNKHLVTVSPTLGYITNETVSGLHAAFYEQNQKGGIAGMQLRSKYADESGGGPNSVNLTIAAMMASADVLAVATVRPPDAFVVNPLARQLQVPVFGPSTVNTQELQQSTPNSDYLIHTRQSIGNEGVFLLNYGINSDLHCNHFMIMYLDAFGVPARVQEMLAALKQLNFPDPIVAAFPVVQDPNHAQALIDATAKYAAAAQKPSCVFFIIDASVVIPMMHSIRSIASPAQWDDTHFLLPSTAELPRWVDPISGTTELFKNVFVSQPFPSGFDTRFTFIQHFNTAMAALKASGTFDLTPTWVPNAFAIDGYLAGRLLIAALSRIPLGTNITRKALKDIIYSTRTFPIDDLVLGPYSNGCVGQQTSDSGACWCTSGLKRVFMTKVNTVTGLTMPVFDSPYYPGVADLSTPVTQCELVPTALKRPFITVVPHDTTLGAATSASSATMAAAITAGIRSAVLAALNAGDLSQGPLFVAPYETPAGAPFNATTVTALSSRYRLVFIAGARVDEATAYTALPASPNTVPMDALFDIAPGSALFPDKDMPWRAGSGHHQLRVPFYPTLADLSVTAAAFVKSALTGASSVSVVADTAALAAVASDAVVTHLRALPAAVSTAAPGSTAATLDAIFAALPKGAQAPVSASPLPLAEFTTAVVVVTRTGDSILAAVRSATASPRTAVVIAADEIVLEATIAANPTLAVPSNVLFTSGLPWYLATNATVRPSAQLSYGRAVGDTILALYHLARSTDGSAAAIAKVAFASGSVPVPSSGIALNPLWSAPCPTLASGPQWPHPSSQCQCSKGLNTFFVHRADQLANVTDPASTASATVRGVKDPLFTFRHAGCGPAFTPLPASASSGLSSTQLALIAVAGSAVVIIAVIAGAAMWMRLTATSSRDNSNAPQDPRQGFTMVFTDIQSSTRLWAEAPEIMGDALDAHHTIIRKVVAKTAGYEVKTIGDSFMVAFKDPKKALKLAFDIQLALYDFDYNTTAIDDVYRQAILEARAAANAGGLASMEASQVPAVPSLSEIPSGSDIEKPEKQAVLSPVNKGPGFEELSPEDYTALWNGLRVRVGVHHGTGSIRFEETTKGYDYYGTVVNTAARVEGVGHGGQVLLTQDAMDAVGMDTVASMRGDVTDLGPQPLRGLPDPVRLYQVLPDEFSQRTFPPLRLDVEIEVDDVSSDAGPADPNAPPLPEVLRVGGAAVNDSSDAPSRQGRSGGSVSTAMGVSVDDVAADAARHLRLRTAGSPQVCAALYEAVSTLLATLKPKKREEISKALVAGWRAQSVWTPAQLRRLERGALRRDELLLMATVGKVTQALDIARKGPGTLLTHRGGQARAAAAVGLTSVMSVGGASMSNAVSDGSPASTPVARDLRKP